MTGYSQLHTAHRVGDRTRTDDVHIQEEVDFVGMMLSDPVLMGLKNAGFVRPSPIQLKAIPLGRCGLDLVVQAKSGTGKTCVFAVIALEMLAVESRSTQVLVIAPAREIAVQIAQVVLAIGSGFPGLKAHTFIGGLPLSEDRLKLKRCHIAIGTPGRVKQLIGDGVMNVESIRLFVLDEADKLMEESFQQDINWIYSHLPNNKQMLALSATYPESLAELLTLYMRNPNYVRLGKESPALIGIRQYVRPVRCHALNQKQLQLKLEAILSLLSTVSFSQCLVFSNYQTRAQGLCDLLNSHGWPSVSMCSSQDQYRRLQALSSLKQFHCRILFSTDLAARGIDAENVNLVINVDVPWDSATYLHRIGRAGRYGSLGLAITLASDGKEMEALQKIIGQINVKVWKLPVEAPDNLWKCKLEELEEIEGIISTEAETEWKKENAPIKNNSDKDQTKYVTRGKKNRPSDWKKGKKKTKEKQIGHEVKSDICNGVIECGSDKEEKCCKSSDEVKIISVCKGEERTIDNKVPCSDSEAANNKTSAESLEQNELKALTSEIQVEDSCFLSKGPEFDFETCMKKLKKLHLLGDENVNRPKRLSSYYEACESLEKFKVAQERNEEPVDFKLEAAEERREKKEAEDGQEATEERREKKEVEDGQEDIEERREKREVEDGQEATEEFKQVKADELIQEKAGREAVAANENLSQVVKFVIETKNTEFQEGFQNMLMQCRKYTLSNVINNIIEEQTFPAAEQIELEESEANGLATPARRTKTSSEDSYKALIQGSKKEKGSLPRGIRSAEHTEELLSGVVHIVNDLQKFQPSRNESVSVSCDIKESSSESDTDSDWSESDSDTESDSSGSESESEESEEEEDDRVVETRKKTRIKSHSAHLPDYNGYGDSSIWQNSWNYQEGNWNNKYGKWSDYQNWDNWNYQEGNYRSNKPSWTADSSNYWWQGQYGGINNAEGFQRNSEYGNAGCDLYGNYQNYNYGPWYNYGISQYPYCSYPSQWYSWYQEWYNQLKKIRDYVEYAEYWKTMYGLKP